MHYLYGGRWGETRRDGEESSKLRSRTQEGDQREGVSRFPHNNEPALTAKWPPVQVNKYLPQAFGLPRWHSPANAGTTGDAGLIPGSGSSLEEGMTTCLENSMDRGAWQTIQSIGLHRVGHD